MYQLRGAPTYMKVYTLYSYLINNLFINDSYWNYSNDKDPYLYEVEDSLEFFDIDNEFEFQLAEKLYKDATNN